MGYTPNGNLIWSAVDEYARNPGILNPFVRNKRTSFVGQYYASEKTTEFLDDDLSSFSPIILKTKPPAASGGLITHYILATEKLANTYRVNDPYWYNTKTLNEKITTEEDNMPYDNYKRDYNNNYASIDRYTYLGLNASTHIPNILLMLASPAELLIIAPDGKKLGYDPINDIRYDEIEEGSYGSSSIGGPEAPSTSSHETKTIWIPNPLQGEYKIQVIGTGEGEYHLYSHNIDENGDFKVDNFTSNIVQGETLEYLLDYNPENIKESEITPPIIDTTPPEAKIYFNVNEEAIKIIGTDDITEDPQVNKEESCIKEASGECLKKEYIYIITDNVGNTLKLWMEKVTHKNNILVRIKKIQYNEDEQIQTEVLLHYVWKKNQDNIINFLSQVLKDQQNFVLNANYHLTKDETKISGYDWIDNQTIKEDLSGLTTTNLFTEQGQFQYEY